MKRRRDPLLEARRRPAPEVLATGGPVDKGSEDPLLELLGRLLRPAVDRLGALRLQRLRWRKAARQVRMTGTRARGLVKVTITGTLGDVEVTVRSRGLDLSRFRGSIEVNAPDLLPGDLRLRAESPATAREKLVEGPDLETGDQPFDEAVLVSGHPVLVAAVLDRVARRDVLRLVAAGGEVTRGRLVWPVGRAIASTRGFVRAVTEAQKLARRLFSPPDPAARLAHNAIRDPAAGVRARNLHFLAGRFADRPVTAETLRLALADSAAVVRLEAATSLGEEGRQVLVDLATAPGSADGVAAAALRALGPAIGVDPVVTLLDEGLSDGRREMVLAALEVLGRCGGEVALERLGQCLQSPADEVAAAAVSALGATGDPGAEAALVAALEHPTSAVRTAAAEALGRAGTVTAVPRLRAAALSDGELRRAAVRAIAAIQSRASGAAPGQLALAAGESGGLALAGEEPGRVSLAEPEATDSDRS